MSLNTTMAQAGKAQAEDKIMAIHRLGKPVRKPKKKRKMKKGKK